MTAVPDGPLSGMAILVTGAANGVGRAIAQGAVEAGADRLCLTDRDGAGLAEMARSLGGDTRVKTVTADLAEADAPGRVVAAARASLGRIDGLVNAAAQTTRGGVTSATPELWDRLFALNARAPFFLMQEVIRDLQARGAKPRTRFGGISPDRMPVLRGTAKRPIT